MASKIIIDPDSENNGFAGVIGAVLLILALAIFVKCTSDSNTGGGNTQQGTQKPSYSTASDQDENAVGKSADEISDVPDRMNLADLYVFACQAKGHDNIFRRTTVTDAYGHTYDGPYFSFIIHKNMNPKADFTELVADGNYRYLSGTFFVQSNQQDDYTTEFLVYADDVLVYSSGPITRDTRPIDFNVEIGNCDIIRVTCNTTDEDPAGRELHGIILVNAQVYN